MTDSKHQIIRTDAAIRLRGEHTRNRIGIDLDHRAVNQVSFDDAVTIVDAIQETLDADFACE